MLGPKKSYVDIIDGHLLAKQDDHNKKPRGKSPLRPSSAGQCTRRLGFEYAEFKNGIAPVAEERDASVIRLLDLGGSIEYNVIRMFKDCKAFEVKYTQQCLTFVDKPGIFVEGSNDLCLWSPETRGCLDVKSKGNKFSSWSKSAWDDMDEKLAKMRSVRPIGEGGTGWWAEDLEAFLEELNDAFFADNFLQLNLYCTNDFMVRRGVDHGSILQYSKNDSRMREVRFKPSQKLADEVIGKFERVHSVVTETNDPMQLQRDHYMGSTKCAFCPYNVQCWEKSKAEIKKAFFDNFPPKKWPKDTNRMPGEVARQLEELYDDYKVAVESSKNKEAVEAEICDILQEAGCDKVRFENGDIYDVKLLKSPRPHLELRRGKL
jgi:hypothetical protein